MSAHAHAGRAALLDGREGEPDGLALENLHRVAEASRPDGLTDSGLAGLLTELAAGLRRGDFPGGEARSALGDFRRALRRCLLAHAETGLERAGLARVADDLADWYAPSRRWRVVLTLGMAGPAEGGAP